MTKHKRIAVTLTAEIVGFIDNVCNEFNKDVDRYEDRLTRSRFISLAILAMHEQMKAEEKANNEKPEN